eukprot:jgi/Hompol1/1366/HPOL_004580-RA
MTRASLVVSHAGAGCVVEALRLRRRVVAVVNSKLQHNHQRELATALHDARLLLCALDPADVPAVVRDADWEAIVPFDPPDPAPQQRLFSLIMIGVDDACFPAYKACILNNGNGFISTLTQFTGASCNPSFKTPPAPYSQICSDTSVSGNPFCTPYTTWISSGICSSICYTCSSILPDIGFSATYLSPDDRCQTLAYACTNACQDSFGNGAGVVPICLPNYLKGTGGSPNGSVGTCVCTSLATPVLNLTLASASTVPVGICSIVKGGQVGAKGQGLVYWRIIAVFAVSLALVGAL